MHFTNKHPVTELHILSLPLITEQENLDEFISHLQQPRLTGQRRTEPVLTELKPFNSNNPTGESTRSHDEAGRQSLHVV